jgi:hypothetical protein
LGGIAIIWIFKRDTPPMIDRYLIFPLALLAILLFLDLTHYVVGGKTWLTFYRREEKKILEKKSRIKPMKL